jgi:hypothetical protein
MTLSEFIAEHDGRPVIYKKYAWVGASCVALARTWVEALGLPQFPGVTGAADMYRTYDPKYYDRIAYAPGLYPMAGDLVVWRRVARLAKGKWVMGPGHVAIAVFGEFCFSQNDPAGEPPGIVEYPGFTNVLGWLHPKA